MTASVLRKVLALDAASCAAFFVLCVPLGEFAADLTGLPSAVVQSGGWICLAAAALFAALALSSSPSRPLVLLGALGNAAWIAASLAVVAVLGAQMSALGMVLVIGQAAAVGVLTWLEIAGARPLTATA
jgi:hypothetical protein